jgi:hypothetical protein
MKIVREKFLLLIFLLRSCVALPACCRTIEATDQAVDNIWTGVSARAHKPPASMDVVALDFLIFAHYIQAFRNVDIIRDVLWCTFITSRAREGIVFRDILMQDSIHP